MSAQGQNYTVILHSLFVFFKHLMKKGRLRIMPWLSLCCPLYSCIILLKDYALEKKGKISIKEIEKKVLNISTSTFISFCHAHLSSYSHANLLQKRKPGRVLPFTVPCFASLFILSLWVLLILNVLKIQCKVL